MNVGLRVIRGPNWDDKEIDGGEGFLGTVVAIGGISSSLPEKLVTVQWDCGNRHNHRAGLDGAYDLCVFDSSPTGVNHGHIQCRACSQNPILGMCWHCVSCGDVNLCTSCYMLDKHDEEHRFERIDEPGKAGVDVGTRNKSRKTEAKGIFRGARVVRGPDWEYDDQDGGIGNCGVVRRLTNWRKTPRSAVVIRWNKGSGTYRVGFNGKVDILCKEPGNGGCYYRDHLRKLGEPIETKQKAEHRTKKRNNARKKEKKKSLEVGDSVRIDMSLQDVISLNNVRYGWTPDMENFIGKVGTVHSFEGSDGINILFDGSEQPWTFDQKAISKVFTSERPKRTETRCLDDMGDKSSISTKHTIASSVNQEFRPGVLVRVMGNEEVVKSFQVGHGVQDKMLYNSLGKEGTVKEVDVDGDIEVLLEGSEECLTFNPAVLSVILKEGDKTKTDREADAALTPVESMPLYLDEGTKTAGATLVNLASLGDLDSIGKMFSGLTPEKRRRIVDYLLGGHTALHQACHSGHVAVAETLLQNGASLQVRDSEGYSALHHASYGDYRGLTAELLIKNGADINDQCNSVMSTPLHLAVEKHNSQAASILILHGCNVNLQNIAGVTPLHIAVTVENSHMIETLLNTKAATATAAVVDLRICDHEGLNPLHVAAQKKFTDAVKQMISHTEDIINAKERNGFTPLHLSVLNNDVETVMVLLQSERCDVNVGNNSGATAVDLATSAGNGAVLNLLAGYDAKIRDSISRETLESVVSSASCDLQTSSFINGDKVCLKAKGEALKALQIGHGGWNFTMSLVSEKTGSVIDVLPDGDVCVFFEDLLQQFVFNPAALKLHESPVVSIPHHSSPPVLEYTPADGDVGRKELCASIMGLVMENGFIFPLDRSEEDVSAILFHAISTSNQSSMRSILEVYPDKVNCKVNGTTPLHVACKDGSVDVLRILLECTRPMAHVEAKEDSGFTPLHYAALGDQSGHAAEMLLKAGANVNAHDNNYRATPLHLAVMCCNEATFNVLLGQQRIGDPQGSSWACDVNHQNCGGDTALHEAARTGNEGFVDIMLMEGINVELNNCNGLNPFQIAVLDGNELIVSKMLSWKPDLVNVYTFGDDGMPPLHLACWKAHCGVAQILLDVDLCDFRARDFQDRTALAIACMKKLKPVVRRLLEAYDGHRTGPVGTQVSEQIDKDTSPHNRGSDVLQPTFHEGDLVKVRESLEVVSSLHYGHRMWSNEMQKTLGEIGRILKINKRGDVEVMFEDGKQTFSYHPSALIFICKQNEAESQPLQYPEGYGDDGEATEEQAMNKEHHFALPRAEPFHNEDENPPEDLLHAAIMCHTLRVTDILQKAPDLVDCRPRGYTALHISCRKGFAAVIEVLLQGGADSNLMDNCGLHPLHLSAAFDRSGVSASLLIKHKADLCVTTDDHGLTALHLAVLTNNEAAARGLIEGGCEVNAKDAKGKTVLQYAIMQEKDRMLEVILEAPLLDILLPDEKGFNPLHEAVEMGNIFAIEKTVSHHPTCLNVPNIDGSTALHLAVLSNRREVIQLLLTLESIDTNAVNGNNETPLQLAISRELPVAADLLLDFGMTFEETAPRNNGVSEEVKELKMKTIHGDFGETASTIGTPITRTESSSSDDGEDRCVNKEHNGRGKRTESPNPVCNKKIESEDETSWQFPQDVLRNDSMPSHSGNTGLLPTPDTLPHTSAKTQTYRDEFHPTNSVEKTYPPPSTATPVMKPQAKENVTKEPLSFQEEFASTEGNVEFRREQTYSACMNSNQEISEELTGPATHHIKIPEVENDVKNRDPRKILPDGFLCPICNKIMKDPVMAADGFSYERKEIESWLRSGKCTSPKTKDRLEHNTLIPNRLLKTMIEKHQTQWQ